MLALIIFIILLLFVYGCLKINFSENNKYDISNKIDKKRKKK